MNQSSNLEREKGLEERPSGVPYSKGKLRLLLGTAASLMVACVGAQTVEAPATPQPEPIVPDVEETLRRQDAQYGLVFGRWWYIPCPPGSTMFEFYNLVSTQGEGPHAVSGGINPMGELNRLYVNPNKPSGVYEQEQRLQCYKDGDIVEIRGFRYKILLTD